MYARFTLYFLCAMLLSGCEEKDCCLSPGGERVEFYLLSDFEVRTGSFSEIDWASLPPQPYISHEEILTYDPDRYSFTISDEALVEVRHITEPKAFAVAVDREIIYTGFFWPNFMSASCDCLRIDPLAPTDGLRIELGYQPTKNLSYIDSRNHDLLLATLYKHGKLL